MSNINYKIPKIQMTVDILIANHIPFQEKEFILFLDEFSRYRKGKETIFEFLNNKKPGEFLPLKNAELNEFLILNIDNIIYVKEKESFKPQVQKNVFINLKKNIDLEVQYFQSLPDSQSRILDFLNQDIQFILFNHEGRKIFINKNYIVKVREL